MRLRLRASHPARAPRGRRPASPFRNRRTSSRFPDSTAFPPEAIEDSTLPEIGVRVGGPVLQAVLTAAGFAATLASWLASHASVSRMLMVMGRNNVLPRRIFGFIDPKTHTPTFSIVIVGVVSLLAIEFRLEQIAASITDGALVAFSFVNISVIAWFAVRRGLHKTPGDVFRCIVMPGIGLHLTALLWVNLDLHPLIGGLIWTALGVVYLVILTCGLRRPIASFDENEPATGVDRTVPGPRSEI